MLARLRSWAQDVHDRPLRGAGCVLIALAAAAIIPIICLLNLIFERPKGGFASRREALRRWGPHVVVAILSAGGILSYGCYILGDFANRMPYKHFVIYGFFGRMNGWCAVSTFTLPFNITIRHDRPRVLGAVIVSATMLLGLWSALGLPMPKRLRGHKFRREALPVEFRARSK